MLYHDVVVADDEESHRTASVSTLIGFGFPSSRVHVVEDVDGAVEKVKEIDKELAEGQNATVIAFLAPSGCTAFSQQKFRSQTFVVRTSESVSIATPSSGDEQASFRCTVPRKIDEASLSECSEWFQSWMAECAKENRMKKFHEAAARKRQARAGRPLGAFAGRSSAAAISTEATRPAAPAAAAVPPTFPSPPEETQSVAPKDSEMVPRALPQRCAPYVDLGNVVHTGATPTPPTPESTVGSRLSAGDRRNQLESLAHLLPARSPFEDIKIIELVGRGSFGSVFKARWDFSEVALKVLQHKGKADLTTATFEGALASSLAHPNLVQTFKHSIREAASGDSVMKGWEVWIVQEWCGLGTLGNQKTKEKVLQQGGFAGVVELSCEIASAASYLHSRGIVHGDLSGNNVLLCIAHCSKGFVAKVGDFGMARVLGNADALETRSMGTVSCMPPEMFLLTGAALTTKVDVYAFGVLVWALCTGKTPHEGKVAPQIVVQVSRGCVLELPSSVPTALADLYKTCVAREPSERPNFDQIVRDLIDMLEKDILKT